MEAFKKAGGLAFKKKDFKEAVKMFTKAIELDSKNTSLYGNRSVAYLKCKDYSKVDGSLVSGVGRRLWIRFNGGSNSYTSWKWHR